MFINIILLLLAIIGILGWLNEKFHIFMFTYTLDEINDQLDIIDENDKLKLENKELKQKVIRVLRVGGLDVMNENEKLEDENNRLKRENAELKKKLNRNGK